MSDPITDPNYGNANWVDYSNYWREKDAEWLMDRTVLRYVDGAARNAQYGSPKYGQVTYNESNDKLEVYSKTLVQQGASPATAWASVMHYANLTSTQDTTTGVAISHKQAAGKGIVFEPARVTISNPLNVMGGVLTADTTLGVGIKTGALGAKLTTTATELVLENQNTATPTAITLKVPNLNVTGTLTAVTGNFTSITVPNISVSGVISGGGTFTGTVNSTTSVTTPTGTAALPTGTIGGVSLGGSQISAPSGGIFGSVYADAGGSAVRYRNPVGGASSLQSIAFTDANVRFRTTAGIQLDNVNNGVHTGAWVGFVYTSDPGPALAPPGSLLFLA